MPAHPRDGPGDHITPENIEITSRSADAGHAGGHACGCHVRVTRTPAVQGNGAYPRLITNIKSALAWLLLISLSSLPSLAQTEKAGIFENLPAQASTNIINGTLGDIDTLNTTLDDAIAKSSASVDAYAQAINEASASFSLARRASASARASTRESPKE